MTGVISTVRQQDSYTTFKKEILNLPMPPGTVISESGSIPGTRAALKAAAAASEYSG
jgi:hypothetical protein